MGNRTTSIILAALGSLSLTAAPALAGGSLLVVNETPHGIKLAAPGGRGTVPAGAPPTEIPFDTDDTTLELKIWFSDNPRQLCKIITPLDRKVVVSGGSLIACLSRDR